MKKSLSVAALAATGLLALGAGSASAAATTVTVTASNFKTEFPRGTPRPVSSFAFTNGPATPPLGTGSLTLETVDTNAKQQHLSLKQAGTKLSAVDAMGYATYRYAASTATPVQVAAINMEIDENGPAEGGYTTLVYEPVYNNGSQPIVEDAWTPWDAYRGGQAIWWSTKAIPGVCAFTCYVSWSTIVASNPNAVVLSYGINQGGGNAGLKSGVDALRFGAGGSTTTYDFELVADRDGDGVADGTDNCIDVPNADQGDVDGDGVGTACDDTELPTSKEQCKNGGFRAFKDGGTAFRNQGDCVSFVATGGKNGPRG